MRSECRDRGVACRSRRRVVLRGARNGVSGVKPPPRVPEARDALRDRWLTSLSPSSVQESGTFSSDQG